jgi:hypothetical protein
LARRKERAKDPLYGLQRRITAAINEAWGRAPETKLDDEGDEDDEGDPPPSALAAGLALLCGGEPAAAGGHASGPALHFRPHAVKVCVVLTSASPLGLELHSNEGAAFPGGDPCGLDPVALLHRARELGIKLVPASTLRVTRWTTALGFLQGAALITSSSSEQELTVSGGVMPIDETTDSLRQAIATAAIELLDQDSTRRQIPADIAADSATVACRKIHAQANRLRKSDKLKTKKAQFEFSKIETDDLIEMVRRDASVVHRMEAQAPVEVRAFLASEEFWQGVQAKYRELDVNGSRSLDADELFPVMVAVTEAQPWAVSEEDCRLFLDIFDSDQSGRLEMNEFEDLLRFCVLMHAVGGGDSVQNEVDFAAEAKDDAFAETLYAIMDEEYEVPLEEVRPLSPREYRWRRRAHDGCFPTSVNTADSVAGGEAARPGSRVGHHWVVPAPAPAEVAELLASARSLSDLRLALLNIEAQRTVRAQPYSVLNQARATAASAAAPQQQRPWRTLSWLERAQRCHAAAMDIKRWTSEHRDAVASAAVERKREAAAGDRVHGEARHARRELVANQDRVESAVVVQAAMRGRLDRMRFPRKPWRVVLAELTKTIQEQRPRAASTFAVVEVPVDVADFFAAPPSIFKAGETAVHNQGASESLRKQAKELPSQLRFY